MQRPRYTPVLTMRLSVIVITRNEQANIAACLQSVGFADEIIVVDHGSTDGTAEMARALGAEVTVVQDWPGFGLQKNRALALATGDWVLSIDADERISDELRVEILNAIERDGSPPVYRIPRMSSYCGQFMRHSGWNPDFVTRLFKRGHAEFSSDLVHERLLTESVAGSLKSKIIHLSFPDFESVLDKVNRYSTAGAMKMQQNERHASLWSAVGHAFWAFFRTYFLRLGVLDGQLGLALAISNAEGTYYRYLKRWLMIKNARNVK